MAINMMRIPGAQWTDQSVNFKPIESAIGFHQQVRGQNIQAENQNAMLGLRHKADARADAALELQRQKLARGQPKPWWVGPGDTVHPAMLAKVAAGRANTNVNVKTQLPEQEKAFDKAAGKGLYDEYAGYQKQLAGAHSALGQLKVMDQALADPNLYTGTGGASVQFIKRAAKTLFGVDVGGVASGEVVGNLSNKIALSMKDSLPGPLSNSDRDFLVSIAPGLSKSKVGNAAIIKIGMAQREYEIDVARAAQAYAKTNGGRLNVGWHQARAPIDAKYAARFGGLMDEVRNLSKTVQQTSPTAGLPNPGAVVSGYRFRGGNPADRANWVRVP